MYNKFELVSAITRLMESENEKDQDILANDISINTLDPQWMDYIFQSDTYILEDGTLDIQAVADKIISYKPIGT